MEISQDVSQDILDHDDHDDHDDPAPVISVPVNWKFSHESRDTCGGDDNYLYKIIIKKTLVWIFHKQTTI